MHDDLEFERPAKNDGGYRSMRSTVCAADRREHGLSVSQKREAFLNVAQGVNRLLEWYATPAWRHQAHPQLFIKSGIRDHAHYGRCYSLPVRDRTGGRKSGNP